MDTSVSLWHGALHRAMLAGCVLAAAATLAQAAQPLSWEEVDARRAAAAQGPRLLVAITPDCHILSTSPNHPSGYTTVWQGPCENGLAHGPGTRRLSFMGQPLSTGVGRYDRGQWMLPQESYAIELGRIVRTRHDPATGQRSVTVVEPSEVPPWAADIVRALPAARASWDEEVARRRHAARLLDGSPVRPTEEDPQREILFAPEPEPAASTPEETKRP